MNNFFLESFVLALTSFGMEVWGETEKEFDA